MMVLNFTPAWRRWRCFAAAALLPVFAARAGAAAPKAPKVNEPVVRLSLESLGFTPAPPHTLGSSLYTLNFVDATHLLFTFNSRGLLTRLPDATPEDDDRNVTALLVELPTGKILARTVWRTRDRDQYLWPLTHGRFLLRIRNKLTVIQPLEDVATEHPFQQQPFLELKRRIAYVSVSPGGDLLTVETAPPRKSDVMTPAAMAAALAAQVQAQARAQAAQGQGQSQPMLRTRNGTIMPAATSGSPPTPTVTPPKPVATPELESERPGRPPVDLHFFRLFIDSTPGQPERLAAQSAGLLTARGLANLPVTAEGFLEVLKENEQVYNFDFQTHTGKRMELAAYDTTCVPRPYFVSRSEFVAFGCHGSADKVEFSGFNLKGEEPWVSVFSNQHVAPAIVTAPDASRFALSRILMSANGVFDLDNIQADELTGQEIAVMQNHDGRTLLKLLITSVQRSSQNFDLSADGLFFTVVRAGNIEVYRLPPLTPADQKDVQVAVANVPEKNDVAVKLLTKTPASAPPAEAVTVPTNSVQTVTVSQPEAAPGATVGDAPPGAPRKAPSLYDPDHPKPPIP